MKKIYVLERFVFFSVPGGENKLFVKAPTEGTAQVWGRDRFGFWAPFETREPNKDELALLESGLVEVIEI